MGGIPAARGRGVPVGPPPKGTRLEKIFSYYVVIEKIFSYRSFYSIKTTFFSKKKHIRGGEGRGG
jgi:hypothetical protein